ncbi:MAG: 30S processome protein Utp24 [archaeon]|nr:30S processome protein Utp24 [archaeon]
MAFDRVRSDQVVKMAKVLLDTSFILLLASKPLASIREMGDALGKAELLLLKDTIKELEAISKRSSIKRSKLARSALDFARNLEVIDYIGEGTVDDKILKCALEKDLIVATMDRELRRKLRAMGLPVITLKGDRVMVEGAVS